MIKTFKTRIRPNKEQEVYLNKCFGYRRFIYNNALEYFNTLLKYNNNVIDKDLKKFFDKFDYITHIYSKKEKEPGFEWTKEYNKTVKNEVASDFNITVNKFFKDIKNKKRCKLHFKRKIHGNGSFRIYNKNKGNVKIIDKNKFSFIINREYGHMSLKTFEDISFLYQYEIKTMTISMKNFKYYVSFTYELDVPKHTHTKNIVGVDLGILNPVVCFDGKDIINPKFPKGIIKKLEKKTDKLSTIVSKKKYDKYDPSKNYIKARTKLNDIYIKIVNIRMDYIQKVSTFLAKTYRNVVVDEFSFKELLTESDGIKRINRGIHRVGAFTFTQVLKYKCYFYGSEYILALPNTTNTCSECNHKLKTKLKLSQRIFNCPICGHIDDRDNNAAINIYKSFKGSLLTNVNKDFAVGRTV